MSTTRTSAPIPQRMEDEFQPGSNPNASHDFLCTTYSQAAQVHCAPLECLSGTVCGTVTCLLTPVIACVACMTICCTKAPAIAAPAPNSGGSNQCTEENGTPICFSWGYNIGGCLVRVPTRIIGCTIGCMACDTPDREEAKPLIVEGKTDTFVKADLSDNKSTLFCGVTREKAKATECCVAPFKTSIYNNPQGCSVGCREICCSRQDEVLSEPRRQVMS